jgi:DNA-directed RNA polymerase subunit alpha
MALDRWYLSLPTIFLSFSTAAPSQTIAGPPPLSAIMPPVSCHTQTTEGQMAVTRIPIPAWAKNQEADDRLDLSLAEIDLIVRTVNCLEDAGIFTVRDLLNCTAKQLLEIPNFAEKTLETIYEALAKIGFNRTAEPDGPPARDFALLRE